MYALINTMPKTDTIVGRVISTHRSIDSAVRYNIKLQAATRKYNGENSYLPTIIVRLLVRANFGALVDRVQTVSVNQDDAWTCDKCGHVYDESQGYAEIHGGYWCESCANAASIPLDRAT